MLGAIAATLVAAPPAHAATAFVDGRVLRFVAAPGERNEISLNTITGTGATDHQRVGDLLPVPGASR